MSAQSDSFDRVQAAYQQIIGLIVPLVFRAVQKTYGDGWNRRLAQRPGPLGHMEVCPWETLLNRWDDIRAEFPPVDEAAFKRSLLLAAEARDTVTGEAQSVEPATALAQLEALGDIARALGATSHAERFAWLSADQRAAMETGVPIR